MFGFDCTHICNSINLPCTLRDLCYHCVVCLKLLLKRCAHFCLSARKYKCLCGNTAFHYADK